jgi:CMP-N,N'-diacetyllegionaminic acid synthase
MHDRDRSLPTVVALIPARSGSRRVPGKNLRPLAGHPLIAYTIAAAQQSGVFSRILVSTDDEAHAAAARHYGAEAPFLRPAAMAGEASPDIMWVQHALAWLAEAGPAPDAFSILRPTSPFRSGTAIEQAWHAFVADGRADSLRAVERCRQHPGKMWVARQGRLLPLLPFSQGDVPWHSNQYTALPEVWVQNGSLEIAWTRVAQSGSIAGADVMPFVLEDEQGFDINTPDDWDRAVTLVNEGRARLPRVDGPEWRRNHSP